MTKHVDERSGEVGRATTDARGGVRGRASQASSTRTFHRILALVTAILVGVAGVSILGAVQMAKIQREVGRLAREIMPFSETISRMTYEQLHHAMEIEHALLILGRARSAPVREGEYRALQEHVEWLKGPLDAQYGEVEGLLHAMRVRGAKVGAGRLEDLQARAVRVREAQETFRNAVLPVVARVDRAGSDENRALLLREIAPLEQFQHEIDARSRELRTATTELVEWATAEAGAHERVAEVLLGAIASISLLFALLLWVRREALHRYLVASEQATMLANTLVTLHHEVNNPLAIIVGNAQLLSVQSSSMSEEHRSMLSTIQEMAMRIREVLHKLSRLERITFTNYVEGTSMLNLHPAGEADHRERESDAANAPPKPSR